MTGRDIRHAIATGEFDDELEAIAQACVARKKRIGDQVFDTIEKGDRVIMDTSTMRPRYLNGAEATVVEKRVSKITIEFGDLDHAHDPYGKWSNKRAVVSPTNVRVVTSSDA